MTAQLFTTGRVTTSNSYRRLAKLILIQLERGIGRSRVRRIDRGGRRRLLAGDEKTRPTVHVPAGQHVYCCSWQDRRRVKVKKVMQISEGARETTTR